MLLILVQAVGLAALACPGAVYAGESLRLDRLDETVPAFELQPSRTGRPALDNQALRGRTVLLHFWATWCTPCRTELPALQRLAERLDDKRFTVVLVAIDDDATAADIIRFAGDLGITLPLYLARRSRISERYWAWGVPVTYLVDADGAFIGRALGPRSWDAPTMPGMLAAIE